MPLFGGKHASISGCSVRCGRPGAAKGLKKHGYDVRIGSREADKRGRRARHRAALSALMHPAFREQRFTHAFKLIDRR
jgi:sulfite reductase beta subunit-like hemoprotein